MEAALLCGVMGKEKVSDHFIRLGMSQDMQRSINEWCAANADPQTGKLPSFSEGCRRLIACGLRAKRKGQGNDN
jgi:hypothetical protein